ncbi:hypothetical protein ABOM_000341 [Aspergillus bombycis]|uniref:Zn(2)-C6 fungal-type domain-containing protein n=1 Tax=Aspergillus bombycis TaxID=109264 RepID=A0A1F8AHM4_9EURO|nr:hypothetical protein ABOM_000341 [Aspergillus bombycis]OGM51172.1 hypothetical protein ABOM_000341 [Aspergillus bombycis]
MATSTTAAPNQRLKTCQQCRLRKVRCDGRRSICGNCDRLQFACSFQDLGSSSLILERPERLRARQACSRCHSLKVRCSGHLPACLRCQKRGRPCVYTSSPPRTGNTDERNGPKDVPQRSSEQEARTPAEPPTNIMCVDLICSPSKPNLTDGFSTDAFKSPDDVQIQVALDTFFMRIYPLPGYAILHRASLYDRFHRGQIDQCLLLSIIAISTCLTEIDSSKREYAVQCLTKAEQLIINNLSQPSIIRTQALLLIVRCKMCLGEYSSAFPLVSLLSRFAFSLRLNYENQRVCFLAREARRRLMWAIYMLDQNWAAGLLEFTTCPVDAIYVGLPCPEETWELDVCPETEVPLKSQTKLPGLLAANVCVSYLRDKVLRHVKRFAAGNCSAIEIMYGIRELETELEHFYLRLPPSSAYSERNLRLRAHSPWLPRFIVLHVLWHQCYCDLYRCITRGLIESVPAVTLNEFDNAFVLRCREQCTHHAVQIAGILTSLIDLRLEFPVLSLDMAVCAYQCIRLLVHGQRTYGHKILVSRERVKQYQRSCLQVIQTVARTSPSVQTIVSQSLGDRRQNRPRPTQQQGPRQILSIHSLIARSEFVDDSEELALQDVHASDNPSAYEKQNHEYSGPLSMLGLPSPLPSFDPVEHMTLGSTVASQMWLQGGNAFEGAWDEPGLGFDLIRQMQWDGMGHFG